MDRRTFVGGSALAVAGFVRPGYGLAGSAPMGQLVVEEPWGRLEEVGDRAWALISKPLEDRTTLCNGGIVGGASRTLVIESFATPDGAAWMARMAKERTGRWPTDVVLTHFHGDHANGLEGFAPVPTEVVPRIFMTSATRDLIRDADRGSARADDPVRQSLLDGATMLDPGAPTDLDLGGMTVTVSPRVGHTPSDVSLAVQDQNLVYTGDLMWNAMFPNYRDAIPSRLAQSVRALRGDADTRYVPGHGAMGDAVDFDRYVNVIDAVGDAARRGFEAGVPAAEGAQSFALPPDLGEWFMFSPRYFEVAFTAWERELGG